MQPDEQCGQTPCNPLRPPTTTTPHAPEPARSLPLETVNSRSGTAALCDERHLQRRWFCVGGQEKKNLQLQLLFELFDRLVM